jgi:hypothetical protein
MSTCYSPSPWKISSKVTDYELDDMDSNSGRDTVLSLRYEVQTCFADHAASCPMGIRSCFPVDKVAGT